MTPLEGPSDQASQASSILSTAPSFSTMSLPMQSGMICLSGGIQDQRRGGVASPTPSELEGTAGPSVPEIFLKTKKARKSWVWNAIHGEEYLEDGRWRWRCARCRFKLLCSDFEMVVLVLSQLARSYSRSPPSNSCSVQRFINTKHD